MLLDIPLEKMTKLSTHYYIIDNNNNELYVSKFYITEGCFLYLDEMRNKKLENLGI
jgi:hypothetical protein